MPEASPTQINVWRETYFKMKRRMPSADQEPTTGQLTALNARTAKPPGGAGRAPAVDFAMFHLLTRLTSRAMEFYLYYKLPDGKYKMKLTPGPQNKDQWILCFELFMVAAIMLDVVEDHALDEYKVLVNDFMKRYGRGCWHLCYAADVNG